MGSDLCSIAAPNTDSNARLTDRLFQQGLHGRDCCIGIDLKIAGVIAMNSPQERSLSLAYAVVDELGVDAYHIYPDERHLIGEAQLLAIAVGCIVAFAKGFFNFEDMGQDARKYLLGLLDDFLHRRPRSEKIDMTPVTEMLIMIKTQRSIVIQRSATDSLRESLREFGMSDELAEEHSVALTKLIEREVR